MHELLFISADFGNVEIELPRWGEKGKWGTSKIINVILK